MPQTFTTDTRKPLNFMRTFLHRCLLAGLIFTGCVTGTVAVCVALACSRPGFYAQATAQPMDQADAAEAMNEIARMGESLKLFIQLGEATVGQLETARRVTNDLRDENGQLPDEFRQLEPLLKATEQGAWGNTFEATLSQRHLNAWLADEMGPGGKDWRNPYIAIESNRIRYAVTVTTPAGGAVLSCDFALKIKPDMSLALELHAVRCGRLPLPVATMLRQYMRTNPSLPNGLELSTGGDRPMLTFTEMPEDGKLQLKHISTADGQIHLTLLRRD